MPKFGPPAPWTLPADDGLPIPPPPLLSEAELPDAIRSLTTAQQHVIRLFSANPSLEIPDLAQQAGLAKSTLYHWRYEDPAHSVFRRVYEAVRTLAVVSLPALVVAQAQAHSLGHYEQVHHLAMLPIEDDTPSREAAVRLDAAKYALKLAGLGQDEGATFSIGLTLVQAAEARQQQLGQPMWMIPQHLPEALAAASDKDADALP